MTAPGKRIAVFGAGVAGLTVAHELSRLGYEVVVYEANATVGGFFRSARMPADNGMPSEYSWHGFGPWYHNTFDVMRQIPFDDFDDAGRERAGNSVYDRGLSRPMDFGIAPDAVGSDFEPAHVFDGPAMYRMTRWDRFMRLWLILRASCSNRRSHERYARVNAAEAWRPWMSDLGWKTWRSTFGPWIGSDWTNVSLHTAARFFLKNLFSGAPHRHAADDQGPAWEHGCGAEWLLLRGPSSEYWFDPWVRALEARGVRFVYGYALRRLLFDGTRIVGAQMAGEDGAVAEAADVDHYVLATNPFAARDILHRTPEFHLRAPFRSFAPLVADGPHTQIGFRLAFPEAIRWPRERAGIIVGDSPWNLTLFAQEQVWHPSVDRGEGVASLWTGTACACTVPGRVHGLPATKCTKEQFVEEVLAQVYGCAALDALIRQANDGKGLTDFPLLRVEVWHEWSFSPDTASGGIEPMQPKWVNSTTTQEHMPPQTTPLPNLFLAGAHTKTRADLWSIEAAVESGRRAAQGIDPAVRVIEQPLPRWLRAIQAIDDVLYRVRLPHVLTFTPFLALWLVACVCLLLRQCAR